MDINDLRGVATVFAMLGFIAVCVWAYSSKRKQRFDEAANLPFADEPDSPHSLQTSQTLKSGEQLRQKTTE